MIPHADDYPAALARVLGALLLQGLEAARAELEVIAYPRRAVPRRPAMPRAVMLSVFWRDHWLCRYCGGQTIFTPVMAMLGMMFPEQFPFHPNWKGGQTHPAVIARSAIVDHIVPGAQGGNWSDIENLATACWPCNARKGDLTLEQLGWELRPLADSDWDGLTGAYEKVWELSAAPPNQAHAQWLRSLAASRLALESRR